MQRFGGLLLMLSGVVALGGYLTLPPAPDNTADFTEATRISIAPYHPRRSDESAMRTFSPTSAAFREVLKSDERPEAPMRQTASAAWVTVVTSEPSRAAVLRSAKPGDARTRFELARDLQRELKRAGCYWGEISGVWSLATKRAMAAFMDRANATLPIDAPDYILLSLVQSHAEIICSAACPPGQLANGAGRCVPNAIIAQASKRAKLLEARRATDTRAASDPPSVAAAQPEQLPWLDRDGRSIVAQTSPRPAQPPGMMSIGGPGTETSPPPTQPLPQKVVIERDDGTQADAAADANVVPDGAEKVAALAAENGDASTATAAPQFLTTAKPDKHRRAKHSRDWRDERPRHSGYGGRTRRGDPRPGTMRYNVAQVLGGIY
ncbi:hypothetical protein [Hyphomicrobium denitrificans]|nr:hypothetical protein [Hyphomicrobium denitrificans]